MTTRNAEPERELVRRVLPIGPPASVAALAAGAAVAGWDVGWSAALGIVVVYVNFIANGLSLARAARHSLTALFAVGLGGVAVRLAVIVTVLALLDRFAAWFSPLAFGLAVVPATILLLVFEARLLRAGVGAELVIVPAKEPTAS